MRARWGIPLSIALLLLTALHWHPVIVEATNRLGAVTYYAYVAGFPLPYLRTFTEGPGGPQEYVEIMTARLAADEAFWLAASLAILAAIRRGRRRWAPGP
ncbi:MAG: hypothetical protein ACP5NG_01550 [Conexivisphaera sp.]